MKINYKSQVVKLFPKDETFMEQAPGCSRQTETISYELKLFKNMLVKESKNTKK